jgi:hypothetical protein
MFLSQKFISSIPMLACLLSKSTLAKTRISQAPSQIKEKRGQEGKGVS